MTASATDKSNQGPVGAADAGGIGKSGECPICLKSFLGRALCALPCKHEFHRDCVEELRKQGVQQVCPLCRTALPAGAENLFEDATCMSVRMDKQHTRAGGGSWKPVTATEEETLTQIVDIWTNAADQGHSHAQCNIGKIYSIGPGVAQDYKKAAHWYRKAADQGFVDGEFLLGKMYREGKGVVQDYSEAVRWFRKAAGQGLDHAQFVLGIMYLMGEEVAQDLKLALYFISAAEAQGVKEACEVRKQVEASLRRTSSKGSCLDALPRSTCTNCGRGAGHAVKLKPCPRCKGPLYCG